MTFGELIKEIRSDFKLRQIDMSNIIEVSRPQIANVEGDKNDGSIYWIPMMCERLQISIYYDPVLNGWHYERLS